jgi:hypothetical protein
LPLFLEVRLVDRCTRLRGSDEFISGDDLHGVLLERLQSTTQGLMVQLHVSVVLPHVIDASSLEKDGILEVVGVELTLVWREDSQQRSGRRRSEEESRDRSGRVSEKSEERETCSHANAVSHSTLIGRAGVSVRFASAMKAVGCQAMTFHIAGLAVVGRIDGRGGRCSSRKSSHRL